ncbi:GNAT family N-acetyltransferase [Nocardioides zeae]
MTSPTRVQVHVVEAGDDAGLRTFWEIERASVTDDDPDAPHRTFEALRATRDAWGTGEDGVHLIARDDRGDVAGVAEMCWPLEDNEHLVEADIHVLPRHRREGVGRLLWEAVVERTRALGRTTVALEIIAPVDGAAPGLAFVDGMGIPTVHVEEHLRLPVPVDPDHLARLAEQALAASSGYEVVTWVDRCPDEHVEAFCAMRTRMNQDVPRGEADVEPAVVTLDRLRREEERRHAADYTVITAAVRRVEGGEMAGYTVLVLQPDDTAVYQGDTLVMPEHRGRRLGTLLKVTTLELLADDYPERTSVHTWVSTDNAAMQAVNRAFGFVLVDRAHMIEARVDG